MNPQSPGCVVHRLGRVPYLEACQLQERLAGEIASGARPATLLLLEHPHTYTIGRSGQAGNLLWDEGQRRRRGVDLYWADRGGDITYHGPGQLIGYPLLPLGPLRMAPDPISGRPRLPQGDFTAYLRALEEILIQTLAGFGLAARALPGLTGVWLPAATSPETGSTGRQASPPPAKIAAIGVKVDARGISRHGFALNVDPDMTYWDGIIGCGLEGYPVTSLAGLLHPVPGMAQVMDAVVAAFGEIFGYKMVAADPSGKVSKAGSGGGLPSGPGAVV